MSLAVSCRRAGRRGGRAAARRTAATRSRSPPLARPARPARPASAAQVPLSLFLFDALHVDGTDLVDAPATERFARLAAVTPAELVIPRLVTADAAEAEQFFAAAIERGHEGVVVKSLDAPYGAGRRGSEWIKVKPRHTLDLLVLGSGVGPRQAPGLAVQPAPGRPRSRTPAAPVMLGQDVQGSHRRAAGLADRATARARRPACPRGRRAAVRGVVRVGRSSWSRSPSMAFRPAPGIRAV